MAERIRLLVVLFVCFLYGFPQNGAVADITSGISGMETAQMSSPVESNTSSMETTQMSSSVEPNTSSMETTQMSSSVEPNTSSMETAQMSSSVEPNTSSMETAQMSSSVEPNTSSMETTQMSSSIEFNTSSMETTQMSSSIEFNTSSMETTQMSSSIEPNTSSMETAQMSSSVESNTPQTSEMAAVTLSTIFPLPTTPTSLTTPPPSTTPPPPITFTLSTTFSLTSTSPPPTTPPSTSTTPTPTSTTSSPEYIAIGVIIAVLLIVLIVLVVFIVVFCVRRSRKHSDMRVLNAWESNVDFTDSQRNTLHGGHIMQMSSLSGSQQALLMSDGGTPVGTPVMGRRDVTVKGHPVGIDEFVLYVEQTAVEDLKDEWREIPQRTHDLAAQALMNPLSNRYNNILPYDKNRIFLTERNADGNDYINASYIEGYNSQRSYVCAQGPLQRTVDDFWQMVWDQQSNIVVMLTNFQEGQKSKCAEYFPMKEGSKVFAKMHLLVKIKSHKAFKDYTVRTLEVENTKEKKTILVHHFHYTGWPDFGVPKQPTGVLTLLHHVRVTLMSHDPSKPIIVHCSAGVGRTGTFIALDMLMDQLEFEGESCIVDIKSLVKTLREQRNLMVQAPDQYVFIHKAFREFYLLGHTTISFVELKTRVEEMSPVKRNSGISKFQEQYEALDYVSEGFLTTQVSGSVVEMVRYPKRAPYEGRFININPLTGDDPNNFINASFIDDYSSPKSLIVAQAPMESTSKYFWTLVYELKTPLIVLLCDFQENGEEHSAKFWPDGVNSSTAFDGYKVTLLSEKEAPKYHNTYTMSVHPQEQGFTPHNVTLFHVTSWPEGQPPPTYDLLHLLSDIKTFKKSANKQPIVLACNDGLGRSCLFTALWILSDQLDAEDQVDVVSTFKNIRLNRPGALSSLDYFIQCYHMLLQYKDPLP